LVEELAQWDGSSNGAANGHMAIGGNREHKLDITSLLTGSYIAWGKLNIQGGCRCS